jgi:hypothetical protein
MKMFLYQSDSQNLFKFYCHFLRQREKRVWFARRATTLFLPFLKIEEKRGGGKSENLVSEIFDSPRFLPS